MDHLLSNLNERVDYNVVFCSRTGKALFSYKATDDSPRMINPYGLCEGCSCFYAIEVLERLTLDQGCHLGYCQGCNQREDIKPF